MLSYKRLQNNNNNNNCIFNVKKSKGGVGLWGGAQAFGQYLKNKFYNKVTKF